MKRYLTALALSGLTATAAAQESIDSAVARFYAMRGGHAAWVIAGRISSQAELLLEATRSTRNGLQPADYQTPGLNSLLHGPLSDRDGWRLDSLLTRAFLLYAGDASRGRVEPATVDTQWTAAPPASD